MDRVMLNTASVETAERKKTRIFKKSAELSLEDFGTVPENVSKNYHASKTKMLGSNDQKALSPAGWNQLKQLDQAIRLASKYAIDCQNEDGHWVAEAESNCSIQAEYVMLRRILGLKNEVLDEKLKNYLLREQNEDGGWALAYGIPSCPSVTAEVYLALKFLGETSDQPHMIRAKDFVLGHGGLTQTRIFTRMNFATFKMFDWDLLPALPPELMLLPAEAPFSIYDMSSWARGTVVPLLILFDARFTFEVDAEFHCDELYVASKRELGPEMKGFSQASLENAFVGFDKLLWGFEKIPKKPLRKLAIKEAEKWILKHQESSGDWAGIFPPMVNSIMALRVRGFSDDHPVIRKGLDALHHFIIERDDHARLQCTNSPLWDSALMLTGLLDSGLNPTSEVSQKAADYFMKKQITVEYGDWKLKNKKVPSGGWSFEYFNTWYPDTDDTAAILLALYRIRSVEGGEKFISHEKFYQGLSWLMGMQSENGGFGAFDTNNSKTWLNRIPFADLKSMIDPPTADVTARVLELIGTMGERDLYPTHVTKALKFIKSLQCSDGSWWGRWGVNYVYGTCHVLLGLSAIGEDPKSSEIQKALAWLKCIQNTDGGWGETPLSYNTEILKGQGRSTASQTAWGVMGLLSFCSHESLNLAQRKTLLKSIENGVLWLLKNQKEDGTWEEPEFTGTGFPKHFYLRYHAYRHAFPLTALGRYQELRKII